MSYKQTSLAPLSYKDSGLKVLLTFQVWARLFCRSMHFFVFIFSYLLYECVPCHTRQYQTLSTSGTRTLFSVDYTNWRLKICIWQLQLVAKRQPNNFFNFEPWLCVCVGGGEGGGGGGEGLELNFWASTNWSGQVHFEGHSPEWGVLPKLSVQSCSN